ncbi:MAG: hypothetical protein ACYDDA_09850 [Acidiferrobacteraceae bacterium]
MTPMRMGIENEDEDELTFEMEGYIIRRGGVPVRKSGFEEQPFLDDIDAEDDDG